jgi:hypothetical protein
MTTLNMPGFAAEASLYKTSRYYQSERSLCQPNKAIYPAQFAEWLGGWEWQGAGDLDIGSPRTYGTVNPGNEDRFNACISSCLAGPWKPSHAACWRTCCRQITGMSSCVVA